MPDVNERLHELVDRRTTLPGSIAVMESHTEAFHINQDICLLEGYTMRLAACWDGELDPIGAFEQLSYLHEKAAAAEEAARTIRETIERLTGCKPPPRRRRR